MRFHRPRPATRRAAVSVVVPCYRYGRFLRTSVGSVLGQADVDVDVLVIDDCSDDGSADVARSLADADPRVRVIEHRVNQGHISTYNEGLAQARGEFVVLLSADDALAPGALARATALMEQHPTVGMVYGYSVPFDDEPPAVGGAARSWSTWRGDEWLSRLCRRAENPVSTPEVVMRRAAWEEVGAYDARVPHAADMLLWLQTASRWDIGRVNNDGQALYRRHGANMHLTQFAGMQRDLEEQRKVFEILLGPDGMAHARADELGPAARRALARRALSLARTARRAGGPEDVAQAYDAFARDVVAGDERSRGWSTRLRLDAWRDGAVAAPASRVARHVAWRRWRRYGV